MVEIGGQPMLCHIMSIYAAHDFTDFIVACGYKAEYIREYFENQPPSDWRVDLADTGLDTMTGGRILRLREALGEACFMATYGDGVANMDIAGLLAFHQSHGRIATVTAVQPPGRFGRLIMDGDRVTRFSEKENVPDEWINGGFFVFEPQVFDYLDGDTCILEQAPMERLSAAGQLMAYRHRGFWSHMDTIHERNALEELWSAGRAPWKILP